MSSVSPQHVSYRRRAGEHVARARSLLESGEAAALRYVCLELRLAVEALAFDTLQAYSDEESEALEKALRAWRLDKMYALLKRHDPLADMSFHVEFSVGFPGSEEAGRSLRWDERRLDAAWAVEAFSMFSKAVHQPTLTQQRDGDLPSDDELRRYAEGAVVTIQAILSSPFANLREALRFGHACPSCGAALSVSVLATLSGTAVATCPGCQGKWRFRAGAAMEPASPS